MKRDYQPKVECYGISSDEQGQRCGSTNDSEVCYEGYQCYCTDGDHEHASTGDCGCNTRDTGEDGTAAYKQGC